jgi:hypothetical protein
MKASKWTARARGAHEDGGAGKPPVRVLPGRDAPPGARSPPRALGRDAGAPPASHGPRGGPPPRRAAPPPAGGGGWGAARRDGEAWWRRRPATARGGGAQRPGPSRAHHATTAPLIPAAQRGRRMRRDARARAAPPPSLDAGGLRRRRAHPTHARRTLPRAATPPSLPRQPRPAHTSPPRRRVHGAGQATVEPWRRGLAPPRAAGLGCAPGSTAPGLARKAEAGRMQGSVPPPRPRGWQGKARLVAPARVAAPQPLHAAQARRPAAPPAHGRGHAEARAGSVVAARGAAGPRRTLRRGRWRAQGRPAAVGWPRRGSRPAAPRRGARAPAGPRGWNLGAAGAMACCLPRAAGRGGPGQRRAPAVPEITPAANARRASR